MTFHVEQQVDDGLAGTVIGDLSAAVCFDDGNAIVDTRQVLHARRDAQRVYRRMLHEPQFVRRVSGALHGEIAHRLPGGGVVHAAELPHGGRGDRR